MISLGVVTATYNRSYIITELYESLVSQKYTNIHIKWYVVDDGSSDNTEEIIKSFIDSKALEIVYLKQENQGKMSAINNILRYVDTDFYIEIDSDDKLLPSAFENIEKQTLFLQNEFIGLLFNRVNSDGLRIGHAPESMMCGTLAELYYNDVISGDKNILFRTSLRKEYLYEFEHGERFSTEGRLYNKMCSDGFKFIALSEDLVICEYQDDGYSKNIKKIYKNNPWTHYFYYLEIINQKPRISLKKKYHLIKQYILFTHLTRMNSYQSFLKIHSLDYRLLYFLLFLPGKILSYFY